MGKNTAGGFDAPCRTKNIAREIPPAPWYHHPLVHMTVGGFLPFRLDKINCFQSILPLHISLGMQMYVYMYSCTCIFTYM